MDKLELKGIGAVVVAHPDDETLWAGSLLAEHPGTLVICCSIPRRDPERVECFYEAMATLNCIPILLEVVEPLPTEPMVTLADYPPLDKLLNLTWVVTHNKDGEYGHLHHQSISEHVCRTVSVPVYTFGHGDPAPGYYVPYNPLKLAALKKYNHQSPADGGAEKWEALITRYGANVISQEETFNHVQP